MTRDSSNAYPSLLAPAHFQAKEIANVQVVLDNHEAAVNSLHTAEGSSPQPPCASLQMQADSSPAFHPSDQDMVRRAENNCHTDQLQPSLHDSRRGHNGPLASSKQAKSSSIIEVPSKHHGAAANSPTADMCSSMDDMTKNVAPPQPVQINLVRPQESFSNTGQYQPLKDMTQGLRVSAPFTCLYYV